MQKMIILIIAGFKDLFKERNEDVLEKIKKYPLDVVLVELIGINYKLRGNSDLYSNISVKVQISILENWMNEDRYIEDLFGRLNLFSKSNNNK